MGLLTKPATTILLITEVKTFIADFDRKGQLKGEVRSLEIGCQQTTQLAVLIGDLKVASSLPLGWKVWVFYVRLPMSFITLPTMQIDGLDDEGLKQALLFELEGQTGQSYPDSQLGWQLLAEADEMSDYWLVDLDHILLDEVTKALRQSGCRLMGLLHPAGLPKILGQSEAKRWHRIESWSTQVIAIHRDGPQRLMRAFELDQVEPDLTDWFAEQSQVDYQENLVNFRLDVLPDADYLLNLGDLDDVSQFLIAWMEVLQQKQRPVPIIRKTSSINLNYLYMGGGGSLAMAICIGHFIWTVQQTQFYEDEFKRLSDVDKAMQNVRQQVTKLRDEQSTLMTSQNLMKNNADSIPKVLTALRSRPAELLRQLANASPADLVIESIMTDHDTVTIKGVALHSSLANELASALSQGLKILGWSVAAPEKTDMDLLPEGGPWSFDLVLTDNGMKSFIDQDATP